MVHGEGERGKGEGTTSHLAPGMVAKTHRGLKVPRLIGSKPSKGVKESLKAYIWGIIANVVALADSPQLAVGFEPNVGFSPAHPSTHPPS